MTAADEFMKRMMNLVVLEEKYNHVGVEDEWLRCNLALALQNQVQHFDQQGDKIPDYLKKIGISAVFKLFASLPDFFGLQVVHYPDPTFYFSKAGDFTSISSYPSVKCSVEPNIMVNTLDHLPGWTDREIAYQGLDMAAVMADGIIRHCVEKMIQGAEVQQKITNPKDMDIIYSIERASQVIKDSIGRSANFAILPVAVAKFLKNHIATFYDLDALPTNIRRIGCLNNKWTIYISGYHGKHILVGYRGTHPVDAGYFYLPEVVFWEPKKEENGYVVHKKAQYMLVRSDYFACIEIENKSADSIAKFW